MAAKFTEAVDYQHLRDLARKAAGDEKKRCIELVQFREQKRQKSRQERKSGKIKN